MRPMPPELRRVFRPLMTLLVVSFVVALAAFAVFLYQVSLVYGSGQHTPEAPPSAAMIVSVGIAIPAGLVADVAAWKLARAGLFIDWPWANRRRGVREKREDARDSPDTP